MSQANVELIREVYGRFQAGDPSWKDWVHPQFEWDFSGYPMADVPTRGRGREAFFRDFIEVYFSGWSDYQAEVTDMVACGDDVVVVQHEIVRVRESDNVLERDTFHVWTVRDGLWILWRVLPNRRAALEAAGLPE